MNRNKEVVINKEEEDSTKEKTKKPRETLFDREDKLFLLKAGTIFIFHDTSTACGDWVRHRIL